mmetsp:Transcript_21135/g.66841  ORF Transcript_21135/g.66841 Transcript_21135/m.66841 type:complete len:234 (-) Transcript_21135:17-718(-)
MLHTQLLCLAKLGVDHVRDRQGGGARGPGAQRREQTHRTGAADEHAVAQAHLRPGHGLQCHTHGLQHSPLLERDMWGQLVAVGGSVVEDRAHGARDAIDCGANEPHATAEVVAPLPADLAVCTRHAGFQSDAVPSLQVGHLLANGYDRARALMAHLPAVALAEASLRKVELDEAPCQSLGPVGHVRAADPHAVDLQLHLPRSRRADLALEDPELPDACQHRSVHLQCRRWWHI